MKCIIGLGNPGRKYQHTRHNVGFMVLDELLKRHHWDLNQEKFNGRYTIEHYLGEKILLLKPKTFMNLSGESVIKCLNYYNVNQADILVVYDDLDLPVGKMRLRKSGGHGGHNGMRSIIQHLNTKDFKRLRLGIGRPTTRHMTITDYVLNPFTKDEIPEADISIKTAADACEEWLQSPFEQVMTKYNQ